MAAKEDRAVNTEEPFDLDAAITENERLQANADEYERYWRSYAAKVRADVPLDLDAIEKRALYRHGKIKIPIAAADQFALVAADCLALVRRVRKLEAENTKLRTDLATVLTGPWDDEGEA
jgi:hypothetical protein